MSMDCSAAGRIARPGRWLLVGLVCLGSLLLTPAFDVAGRSDKLVPALALVAVALATSAPVLAITLGWPARRWLVPTSLAVLSGLCVATTVGLGDGWWNVWVLLAATVCGSVPGRPGLLLVLAVPLSAAVTLGGTGATGADIWTVAFTAFLAGAINHVLVRLLVSIAALQVAQGELARTAVVAERERFSRDLHDLLGHTLSVIVVKAEAVRRLSQRDPDAAMQHTLDIEAIGRQALGEVREAVTGYRRTSLDGELARAAVALEAAGIAFQVRLPDAPLPPHVEEVFAWVVREGVTNLVRHSRARSGRLTVDSSDGVARLELADDGAGARRPAGGGLTGLTQRLATVEGRLEVDAAPGGFRLVATVPTPTGTPAAAQATAQATTRQATTTAATEQASPAVDR